MQEKFFSIFRRPQGLPLQAIKYFYEVIKLTKTIKEIWKGNLEPIVHSGAVNPEINKAYRAINCNYEKLEKNINGDLKKILDDYEESNNHCLDLVQEQAFCDGFCLGMKILAEALIGAEEII